MMDLFNFDFTRLGKDFTKMLDELYENQKDANTKTSECGYKYVNDNGDESAKVSLNGDDIDLTTPEGKAKAHKVIDDFENNDLFGHLFGTEYVANAAKTLRECIDNCHCVEDKTAETKKCDCVCDHNNDSDLYSHNDYVDYMYQDELAKSHNEAMCLANEYKNNESSTYDYEDQDADNLYEDDNEYVANAYLEDTVKNWNNVDNKARYRAVRTLADFLDWVDSHIDY